jgi:UDP-N-acetylglucosamine enolpyruvyl transferase
MTGDPQASRPAPIDERRAGDIPATKDDVEQINRLLASLGLRMTANESELRMNTAVTAEVRSLLEAMRVGMKVLGAIGTAATWAAKIASAGAAIWAAWQFIKHGGTPPTK